MARGAGAKSRRPTARSQEQWDLWAESCTGLFEAELQDLAKQAARSLRRHDPTSTRSALTSACGYFAALLDRYCRALAVPGEHRPLEVYLKAVAQKLQLADQFLAVTDCVAVDRLNEVIEGVLCDTVIPRVKDCLGLDLMSARVCPDPLSGPYLSAVPTRVLLSCSLRHV